MSSHEDGGRVFGDEIEDVGRRRSVRGHLSFVHFRNVGGGSVRPSRRPGRNRDHRFGDFLNFAFRRTYGWRLCGNRHPFLADSAVLVLVRCGNGFFRQVLERTP